jgi:hypothetical protein
MEQQIFEAKNRAAELRDEVQGILQARCRMAFVTALLLIALSAYTTTGMTKNNAPNTLSGPQVAAAP